MTDLFNCERVEGLVAPHELSDANKWQQAGFVIKQQRVLCASSQAAQTFCAPGACAQQFHAQLDGNNQVLQREYKPITQTEYEHLAPLRDPCTGNAHLVFAWMPLPHKQAESLPSQTDNAAQMVSAGDVAQQLQQLPKDAKSPLKAQSSTQDLLDLTSIPVTMYKGDDATADANVAALLDTNDDKDGDESQQQENKTPPPTQHNEKPISPSQEDPPQPSQIASQASATPAKKKSTSSASTKKAAPKKSTPKQLNKTGKDNP